MKIIRASFFQRLIMAIASGAMIIPISYLEKFNKTILFDISIINLLIGTIFALLVMVPFQIRINWLKSLLMIVSSIAIYSSVARLATTHYELFFLDLNYTTGITLSGGLGAVFTGIALQLLSPLKMTKSLYSMLTITGLLAGYVFSLTVDSNNVFINAIGFITWQASVFLTIYILKK